MILVDVNPKLNMENSSIYQISLIHNNIRSIFTDVICTHIDKEDALAYVLTTGTEGYTSYIANTDDPHEAIGQWLNNIKEQAPDVYNITVGDFTSYEIKKVL